MTPENRSCACPARRGGSSPTKSLSVAFIHIQEQEFIYCDVKHSRGRIFNVDAPECAKQLGDTQDKGVQNGRQVLEVYKRKQHQAGGAALYRVLRSP